MAIVERQNNLFAAEDWKVAYKAFSKINFQAYDFNSMRKAMVDYVRINYPENFNDFIEVFATWLLPSLINALMAVGAV